MKLNDLMQTLIAVEPSGFPFLSIYLNAEAYEQGRDPYGIWLKKELSEQAKDYEESAEAQSFNVLHCRRAILAKESFFQSHKYKI